MNLTRASVQEARARAALVALAATAALCGFGCDSTEPAEPESSAATPAPLATEPLARSHTAQCGDAMVGGSHDGWRRSSTSTGPFGFFGSATGFADDYRFSDLLTTDAGVKMPVIVSGTDRVIVSIAPKDRDRALLDYGFGGPPATRMAFEPCGRKEVTSWPGGLKLESFSRPVSVRIAVEGETEFRRLSVGRVSPEKAARLGLT